MKHPLVATASCALMVAISLANRSEASTIVFADDFSTSSISPKPNSYLGGWFPSAQIALQEWGGPPEASISVGALNVNTTNLTRTAGIVLSPTLFVGAGEYVLKFDLSSYTGASNNSAVATVWAGSGYDLGGTTANALIVDTYNASLQANGSAQVTQLGAATLTAAATGNEISFTYDGTSAVAIFLGVSTAGFPFPIATFDNVSIEQIPEPSASLLVGVGIISLLAKRRRFF